MGGWVGVGMGGADLCSRGLKSVKFKFRTIVWKKQQPDPSSRLSYLSSPRTLYISPQILGRWCSPDDTGCPSDSQTRCLKGSGREKQDDQCTSGDLLL